MTKIRKVGNYNLARVLGEGSFGRVRLATHAETGKQYAIKILDKDSILRQGMSEQIKKEISIMKLIKHPNVVQLFDVLVSKTKIYLVLELVTGGELFYKLVEARKFDENTSRKYFHQLINAVEFLHFQNVFHRDLKPENLLLTGEDVLKISDFGLSALSTGTESTKLLRTMCGTPNYCAPEGKFFLLLYVVLRDSGYSGSTADVWSCGVILWVFLAGYLPFEEDNVEVLFNKIMHADFKYPKWFTDSAKDLLDSILVPDPSKRFSIAQIKAHPWFSQDYSKPQQVLTKITAAPSDTLGVEVSTSSETSKPTLPTSMNAFELISKSGMMDMSRMLSPNPVDSLTRKTVFTSTIKPASLVKELMNTMQELQIQCLNPFEGDPFVIRSIYTVNKASQVTFYCHIFSMTEGVYLVEFSRGRGSVFEYHKLFRNVLTPAFVKAGLVKDKKSRPSSSSSIASNSKATSSS